MTSRAMKTVIGATLAAAMALPAPLALAGSGHGASYNGVPVVQTGGRYWQNDGRYDGRRYGRGYHGGGHYDHHKHHHGHDDNDLRAPLIIGGIAIGGLLLLNALNHRDDGYNDGYRGQQNYRY